MSNEAMVLLTICVVIGILAIWLWMRSGQRQEEDLENVIRQVALVQLQRACSEDRKKGGIFMPRRVYYMIDGTITHIPIIPRELDAEDVWTVAAFDVLYDSWGKPTILNTAYLDLSALKGPPATLKKLRDEYKAQNQPTQNT